MSASISFDLLIIGTDMHVYPKNWIGILDIRRNGGVNGVKCPDNMTLDGEK